MKKLIIIVFFSVLTIILSLNAVSIKEALINYQRGESNRQFWLEQSMVSLALSGYYALFIPLMPPLFAPFFIAKVAGLGAAGVAGAFANRPDLLRNILGKDTDISSKTSIINTDLLPPIPNLPEATLTTKTEQVPITLPQVTVTPSPIQSVQPSQSPVVSAPGENIFTALLMAAIAGAGYKAYQWYNTPKKDKPIQLQQPVKELKKKGEVVVKK